MNPENRESDSQIEVGGTIPGLLGGHAYTLTGPVPSMIPVMIAVPHAGRAYPDELLQDMRDPSVAAMRLEDRMVDRIGKAVAKYTGATLLVAEAPRAMIDLNRAPNDVDWGMFSREGRPDASLIGMSRRARNGLGLIPRRLSGTGDVWKHSLRAEELTDRLNEIHEPYHRALGLALRGLRDRWGVAVLLDLHSMPTIRPKGAALSPEFVLGDRFGASSHGSISAATISYLHQHDRITAHNRPYSGGYVLERHARPHAGIHALQLEVDRGIYLDRCGLELGSEAGKLVNLLSELVRTLAVQATVLGDISARQNWRDAAE